MLNVYALYTEHTPAVLYNRRLERTVNHADFDSGDMWKTEKKIPPPREYSVDSRVVAVDVNQKLAIKRPMKRRKGASEVLRSVSSMN